MKKVLQEWTVSAPWGRIALISWGNQNGKRVLLVHGREDSAGTYEPLLDYLPEEYYYVGIDLPGHGRSDPFPIGGLQLRLHYVAAVDIVVNHLGWKQFVYIGHSMGSELGQFYNSIYPNRIERIILLDPGLSLLKRFLFNDQNDLNIAKYNKAVESFYKDYRNIIGDTKVYTKSKAIEAVMRARGFSAEQADAILSRNLEEIGPDMFKLSWNKRLKYVFPLHQSEDFYLKLFSNNAPPTLVISANHSLADSSKSDKEKIEHSLQKLRGKIDNFLIFRVDGGHNVHFTNPERIANEICIFLNREFDLIKAKL